MAQAPGRFWVIRHPASADPADMLKAHGYDPEKVDYTVEKSGRSRINRLEKAAGVTGGGKRGVAHRIDDLEDRIASLEDAVF